MNKSSNPKPEHVLERLEILPKVGILTQDSTGMIYLDLDDNWVFRALEVLRPYGYIRPPYFVYPPTPVGAHIKVVTKREAEDYGLIIRNRNIPHLGKKFEFKVVKAFVSYPKIKEYGLETRYKIKVEVTSELMQIRTHLTGKYSPPRNGFFIVVGVRSPDILKKLADPNYDEKEYESSMTQ